MRPASRASLSAITALLLLTPSVAFAAVMTTNVSSDDIIENLTPAEPSPPPPGPAGTEDKRESMSIMPYPYPGGGISVDATITKEVTPDFLALNAWCETEERGSRDEVRQKLIQLYTEIKNSVGKDGRVRRGGGVSVVPSYDAMGKTTSMYTGSLNAFIRILNPKAGQRIADMLEIKGCTSSWDVRLVDTQEYELTILDDLVTRLNKRKTVFEKLLKKSLSRVTSASLSTWVDGYSTYDPDTNTAEATTTLSVTFDIGGRATLPTPRPVKY